MAHEGQNIYTYLSVHSDTKATRLKELVNVQKVTEFQ